ncbi:hypothetical protein WJX72_002353 [[Myrmecia] bisecta]|uniref:RING-CH-type domain-containing protein n=1 Tax=[Myrmecia] bisecta TaxID=41462 RepID=A0AAW1Q4P2_9CHLO
MSSVEPSEPSAQTVGDQVPLLTEHGVLQRMAQGLTQQRGSVSAAFRRAFSWRRRGTSDAAEPAGPAEHISQSSDIESGASASRQPDGNHASRREQADVDRTCSGDAASALQAVTVQGDAGHHVRSNDQGLEGPPCTPGSKVDTPQSTESSTAKRLFNRLLNQNSGRMAPSGSGSLPVCLICLENLSADDFGSGEAIALECNCRGDVAMRHRSCAIKWARVKGDLICDICKAPVRNLPELSPRALTETEGSEVDMGAFDDVDDRNHPHGMHGPFMAEQMPGSADLIFDCIRVTWVAMIICILFFEMNLASALWTGLVVGVAYTLFVRAMYSSQLAILQREQLRQAAALATPQESPPAPHAPVGMV